MSMRWPAQLQDDGAKSFVKSWNELMEVIASKSEAAKQLESKLQKPALESDRGSRRCNEYPGHRCRRHARQDPRHRREATPREINSGPEMTARQMVGASKKLAHDWNYDVVSIGYPGPVLHGPADRRAA